MDTALALRDRALAASAALLDGIDIAPTQRHSDQAAGALGRIERRLKTGGNIRVFAMNQLAPRPVTRRRSQRATAGPPVTLPRLDWVDNTLVGEES